MMIMARDTGYPGLLGSLIGRRVLVWTCDTCARLCNGLGGADAASRLAERLVSDGVDIVGVAHTSASCIMSKVESRIPEGDYDTVVALTCDMGASCARTVSGRHVVNPIITFGPGYLDPEGRPRLASVVCGNVVSDESAEDAADRCDAVVGPFI